MQHYIIHHNAVFHTSERKFCFSHLDFGLGEIVVSIIFSMYALTNKMTINLLSRFFGLIGLKNVVTFGS